eukprot:m.38560 g.38560  ORF g.38560 m.38560 type:complete len:108 (+) comp11664_c0_seq1:52-375(+)
MEGHKARVNGASLAANVARPVVLVGEVVENADDVQLTLNAADGQPVHVSFEQPQSGLSKFVEVTGEVREDGRTVTGWVTTNLGENFDLGMYNQALQLMDQFPAPFHA